MFRTPVAMLSVLALVLSLSGCGAAAPSTVITVGSKEFAEEWILGELYTQALDDRGFNVELKTNIGSTEIIDRALTAHRIDVYPEYTGVILQVLDHRKQVPGTAKGTYHAAKTFEKTRGLGLLKPTPFQNKNAVAVTHEFARKHHLKTIADLRKLGPIEYAEYPDNIDSSLGYTGLVKAYGLSNMKVRSLNIGLQYKALESGEVQAADVFTTDPQLARSNLVILKDTENIFGFQNVAPVVDQSTLDRQPPEFAETLNEVDSLLTVKAMRALNRAVAVNRLPAAEVASRFLEANHVL